MGRSHRSLLMARAEEDGVPACEGSPANTDYWELRIASVFIILVGSALGALLPIWLSRTRRLRVPKTCFFVAKYFGSGVILATAWMHLLSPASDNLRDECLVGILPDYDWAMGIGLATVMMMFLVELVVSRVDFGFFSAHDHGHGHGHVHDLPRPSSRRRQDSEGSKSSLGKTAAGATAGLPISDDRRRSTTRHASIVSYPGGEDHLGHSRTHVEGDTYADFAAQMTALFILEFGVIFHSIFIGLTLAVTDNFIILFIVLVFHQTFEGLGLGSRLAMAKWPKDRRRWTPYILGMLYAVSTPFSIGMGLIAHRSLALNAATSKIVNGVFDAVAGGILMYTGLVELLAHEFMFNPEMREAGLSVQLAAYACVAVGAGLMALLAKWA
ncbi:Zinc/iron permease [Diplogelasinospora grovesii]|uniref:Zinc/iron permease n=1 Tax=Diplogelasinospora grovesii TaxID=303347 RepID=A0AAN6S930_9PEZI|nr:Zinc/iron permease [Diplogelasinospora grovesii]